MFKKLLTPSLNINYIFRSFGQHNKKHIYKKFGPGKKYGGIMYYPRDPDHVDTEPIEPSKLFKVQRIKKIKGCPYWEKNILKQLGIIDRMSEIAIVKNIPEVNAMLWKVKHLVTIKPILFPYGEPTENDINHMFLKENGDCIVTKEIKVDDARIQATEQFEKKPNRLDGETLRKDSRLKWLNFGNAL